jgi:hypothetical protein
MRVVIASHSDGLRGGAERCMLELAAAFEQAQVPWCIAPTPTWLVDTSLAGPGGPLRVSRNAATVTSPANRVFQG